MLYLQLYAIRRPSGDQLGPLIRLPATMRRSFDPSGLMR
jgi:hypothetical protein